MSPYIIISAPTCERPDLFGALLTSLTELELPADARVEFCFVENSQPLTIAPTVAEFEAKRGCRAVALNEPRRGIPFARNAAVEWALAEEADHLVFIDDDETVRPNWLIELWNTHKSQELDLTGGPLEALRPEGPLSFEQKICFRGVQKRAKRIAARAARLERAGRGQRVTVITCNWMCRLDFLRASGLRFDESLGLSGGSDSAFFKGLKARGGRTGWAPNAIVQEISPVSRLSLGYQFARGRDSATSSYVINYAGRHTVSGLVFSVVFILAKLILGTVRLFTSLFDRGADLALSARAFGFAWGRVRGMMGGRSRHYENLHGS